MRRDSPAPGAPRQYRFGLGPVSGRALRALLRLMAPHTLASRIVQIERADFIGRRRELLVADTLFSEHAPASILLVHGATGIGKSVLLREIGRRGADAGWTPVALDAAGTVERPLVLIDDYSRRRRRAAGRAARVAGERGRGDRRPRDARRRLARGWLGDRDARAGAGAVLRRGVAAAARSARAGRRPPHRRRSSAGRAGFRARCGSTRAPRMPTRTGFPGEHSPVLCAYLSQVADDALTGPYGEAFALACVARDVSHAMLAELVPRVEPAAALRWLRGCGLSGNEPLRRQFLKELRARDPQARARAAPARRRLPARARRARARRGPDRGPRGPLGLWLGRQLPRRPGGGRR